MERSSATLSLPHRFPLPWCIIYSSWQSAGPSPLQRSPTHISSACALLQTSGYWRLRGYRRISTKLTRHLNALISLALKGIFDAPRGKLCERNYKKGLEAFIYLLFRIVIHITRLKRAALVYNICVRYL